MAISGNVRYSQLRSGDRSGNGAKVATVTGTLTASKQLQFDGSGNIIASSADVGGGGGGGAYVVGDLNPPVYSEFADLNSPSIVTQNDNNIYLATTTSGSDNIRGVIKAIPSAPFTITIAIIPQFSLGNSRLLGLALYDGTKIRCMNITTSGSFCRINILSYNSVTSFNGGAEYGEPVHFSPMFFRLQDNSTNWIWSYSVGNGNFITALTEARNTFLTPTHVGMIANNTSSSFPGMSAGYFIHWQED
jgi:hypothetical protein